MIVCEVVGNVWGVRRHPSLERTKLLLVQPIDPVTREAAGKVTMALDPRFGSGPGSVVLVVDEGNSARIVLKDKKAPVRTVVCGIVDAVQAGRTEIRYA